MHVAYIFAVCAEAWPRPMICDWKASMSWGPGKASRFQSHICNSDMYVMLGCGGHSIVINAFRMELLLYAGDLLAYQQARKPISSLSRGGKRAGHPNSNTSLIGSLLSSGAGLRVYVLSRACPSGCQTSKVMMWHCCCLSLASRVHADEPAHADVAG